MSRLARGDAFAAVAFAGQQIRGAIYVAGSTFYTTEA